MKFWDSSAVVAICLDEPNSPALRKILTDDPVVAAWWATGLECLSAFSRLQRGGVLDIDGAEQARRILRAFAEAWIEVQPTREVWEKAERALSIHPLSAADGLQLAAALAWAQGHAAGKEFVSLDKRLAEAARLEGFSVVNPGRLN